VLAHIQQFFDARKRAMPKRTRVQALIPEDATVLPNPHGTAPGLAMEVQPNPFRGGLPSWLIMLPGPPRELRPMFTASVVPLMGRCWPLNDRYVCRTLRTTGIGESVVQEKIGETLEPFVAAGLDLGYCARPGQVDVRLAAHGTTAEKFVSDAEAIVRERLEKHVFGLENEELEEVVIRMLALRNETLALAESCTGGGIANRLTNVPGASAVLLAGLVTYSNAAKQKFLGVNAETLAEHGAVSEPVAREMAEAARRETGSNYALSVTGIAGPSGGTSEKPVGTVFIGVAGPFKTIVVRNLNPYDRETFKQVTAQQALELLRRKILKLEV
jgi:nicotinamide-nucleotide amidase